MSLKFVNCVITARAVGRRYQQINFACIEFASINIKANVPNDHNAPLAATGADGVIHNTTVGRSGGNDDRVNTIAVGEALDFCEIVFRTRTHRIIHSGGKTYARALLNQVSPNNFAATTF